MWNSRNSMGLAMDYKDLASLNDIYKILKEPEASQTSYILQFLWRGAGMIQLVYTLHVLQV